MKRLLVLGVVVFLTVYTSAALAHDGEFGTEDTPIQVDWISDLYSLELDHDDDVDYKGWVTVWLWNFCGEDWGDFHFQIKSIFGITNIENIHFLDDAGHEPELWLRTAPFTWEQYTDLTWSIDNDVVGATLDLYFYDEPVVHNQWSKFKFYTDNTTNECDWFRIGGYPTPVPEPATVALLCFGAIFLRAKRRGKQQKVYLL